MARPFTGRHAFLVIAGGFSIIFAVNGAMAWFAATNRPGMVVENSYVAGQQFNEGLAAGRAQQQLGWTFDLSTADGRLLLEARDALGGPLTGLRGEVTLTHPYGSEPALQLPLEELGEGRYAAGPLANERWVAEIRSHRGGQRHYLQTRLEPDSAGARPRAAG